jgi:hypothetical protein
LITLPPRITLSRAAGWRLRDVAPGAVVVRRPTPWGNPFITGKHGNRAQCAARYAILAAGFVDLGTSHVTTDAQFEKARFINANIASLAGKPLACTCPPYCLCHADVLRLMANRPKASGAILRWMTDAIDLRPAIWVHIDALPTGNEVLSA